MAQITGVITGEGRGRQTKPGSHPYFPFIYPPCSPVSFRGRRSIDRLDSNLREHRFAKVFLPFLRVNGRSIFHRRPRHKFDPDHSTFGNEFGKWLEKKKNGSLAFLARCRNFEWKMDERRIRTGVAIHRATSFVFTYLRARKYVMLPSPNCYELG